jgi:hypothetical protein
MDERVSFFRLADSAVASERAVTAARAPAKPKIVAAAKRPPAAPVGGSSGGPVRQMRTALATAIDADTEF